MNKIQEAGNYSPVGFAKRVIKFSKVRDLQEADARQILGFIFTKVYNLSGFKGAIDDIHKSDIREMIMMKYATLSLEEIDYAFRHDRYSGSPIEHFQLFNAEYVAKVIERYIAFIRQVRIDNNLKLSEPIPEPEKTEEEKKQIHFQFLNHVFNELITKGFCDSAWLLWDDLKHKINISVDVQKRLFRIQTKKFLRKKPKKHLITEGENGTLKNTCRSIVVGNYLKKHISSFDDFVNAIDG